MLKIQTGTENEILRKISDEIKPDEFNKYLKLGKEMKKYIKDPDNGGVGLAAPQVGHNKRLIVVSLLRDREDEKFPTIIMMNPKILESSEDTCIEKEGCLSVPGKRGQVIRPKNVKISFIDDNKKEVILYLTGLSSRIVQHEIDHLDGILFVDKLAK
ncbi:MAG: peptide deformylase [Candidatus Gracilibacteria bacterium]|nr:peptide deformylase [Candidatus Gracilibacteria bacterium]